MWKNEVSEKSLSIFRRIVSQRHWRHPWIHIFILFWLISWSFPSDILLYIYIRYILYVYRMLANKMMTFGCFDLVPWIEQCLSHGTEDKVRRKEIKKIWEHALDMHCIYFIKYNNIDVYICVCVCGYWVKEPPFRKTVYILLFWWMEFQERKLI